MQLTRTILAFILICFAAEVSWAQAQSGQVQGYVGPALFSKGNQTDLLSGFTTGFTIGGGVSKIIQHYFVFNPNIEFSASTKEHYSFSLLSIHNNLKFYPFLLSKLRPYIMAVGNISFMNLHQQAFQTTEHPGPSYSVTDPSNIPVDQIILREPDLKLQFAPILGLGIGAGVDIPVRQKFVPFIQYSFVNFFSKSSGLINKNFQNNGSNLSTQNILVGIRYNVYQAIKK